VTLHARAPLRIDFAGGWSDVPAFADAEGGCVVNAAIDRFAHVEVLLGAGRIRLHAADLGEHVTVPTSRDINYDGRLDLHKAALNMLPVTGGIEILTRSDAPGGSGLGASGSLDVALLAVLARARNEQYEPAELAELGFHLETRELGLLGGRQDQYAAAFGGWNRMDFGAEAVSVRAIAADTDVMRDLARHVVLVYTGHSHFSSVTHEAVWSAYQSGDVTISAALRRIRALATTAADALEAADWQQLARVVDDNWAQQQLLDWSIATERTRAIERAVRDAGAWGLKATGAGAGGCLLVICPASSRERVSQAAAAVGGTPLDFGFVSSGVAVWETPDPDVAG
jgi:D-glycero-alpha-D-manno-heptose-7-phosphate kinase